MRSFVYGHFMGISPDQLMDLLSLLGTASPHVPEPALQPRCKSHPAACKQHCLFSWAWAKAGDGEP